MRDHRWPEGTVRAVIESDLVTPATRDALKARLAPTPFQPVLDPVAVALLDAVCAQLVPQPDRIVPVDIASDLHRKLAAGAGNGWRFDTMPDDVTAMVTGLLAIDATAVAMFGNGFEMLAPIDRDAVLAAVQAGTAPDWSGPEPKQFFEELLAGVAESYYSHPIAQEEIGYLGMADKHGWVDVAIGARAPHEPVEA